MGERILDVKNLKINFHTYAGDVKAIRDVSFHLDKGETLAIVGESGSGKSVTTKSLMGLLANNAEVVGGSIMYRGEDLLKKTEKEMQEIRGKDIAMIFQDPMTSLDPTMKIGRQIAEPLMIHKNIDKKKAWAQALEILKLVGIANAEERINDYPHQFSGGQRQRIGIARALAVEPEFIVCDEPISALDVSIQSQIINLLKELQEKHGFTYMFIAHDLNIVKYISDRIAVMYLGNLVELADSEEIYAHTLHPYSQALLASVPIPDPDKEAQKEAKVLSGDVPSPINPKPGCPFANRCVHATEKCRTETPKLREARPGHFVSCHLDF